MKITNVGELAMMNAILGKAGAMTLPLSLRLFVNNRTPAAGDVAADYTQADGGGYAAKSLAAAAFTVTSGAPTVAVAATQTFTFTGSLIGGDGVYGYYLVDANGLLIAAERGFNDSAGAAVTLPFAPSVNGDAIAIVPRLTMDSAV